MRIRAYIRALALLLCAALLPVGAALAEDDGAGDISTVEGEAVPAEEAPEELGDIDLSALVGGEADDRPAPEQTVAPTPEPTGKRWLTSFNYPKEKVNFENEIWSILIRKWGLADFQAAGLMSSLQAESSFCPYNVQGRGGSDDRGTYEYKVNDSVGFGLCQWTSSGRKAALYRYAERHGSGDLVWDFDIQMGYMGTEIDLAALKSTRNLYEAVEWVTLRYERPGQDHSNSWPGARYERGKRLYLAHTGIRYDEPPLRFSASFGGANAAEGIELTFDEAGELVVGSNYYWRLEQVGGADWLDVRCESFYYPGRMEPCVCGYACEGNKRLTLVAARLPAFGETLETTLRFEIWRGEHEVVTVPVTVTCTWADALSRLGRVDYRAPALGLAVALLTLGRGI